MAEGGKGLSPAGHHRVRIPGEERHPAAAGDGRRYCGLGGGGEECLSPLQHHLSFNALTYIETDRAFAEVVFHTLQDKSTPAIIVKPMVSDSPLMTIDGVHGPSLEKLLVDIRRDKDFYYLAGEESSRMLENAFNMFPVNTSKLLRYAGRRGVRTEIENEIKGQTHDK